MSSNSSNERLGFCRPNHNDQSKPYLNGLCVRPDQWVRTPSLSSSHHLSKSFSYEAGAKNADSPSY
jgi:hypothetical protein